MGISKEHLELFESILQKPVSFLLTDEYVMEKYREYLRATYKNETDIFGEKDKYYLEDRLDNFEEMMGEKGKKIINDLFADVFHNQNAEMLIRSRKFAEQFAESDNFLEVESWVTEINEYIRYVNAFLKTLDIISNSSK